MVTMSLTREEHEKSKGKSLFRKMFGTGRPKTSESKAPSKPGISMTERLKGAAKAAAPHIKSIGA